MSKKFVIILILVAFAAAGLGIYSGSKTTVISGGATKSADAFKSLKQYPQPKIISQFQLSASNGQEFTLESLRGNWSLMFFGFTHCPDVCPTALNTMAAVYHQLETDLPKESLPQIIFVSVDPERDTLTVLKKYTEFFHPVLTGVTGKHPQLEALTRQLGLLYTIEEHAEGVKDYAVDHTAGIVLINPEAKLVGLLPAPHDADQISSDLLELFGKK